MTEAQSLFKELKFYRATQIEKMLADLHNSFGVDCWDGLVESEQHARLMADKLIELEQDIKKRYGVNVKELLDVY